MDEEMKRELAALRSGQRNIALQLSKLMALFGRIEALESKVVTRDEFYRTMDPFIRDIEAARRDRVARSDLYMDHERRIARPSPEPPKLTPAQQDYQIRRKWAAIRRSIAAHDKRMAAREASKKALA